jgi:hypothetical protein
MIKIEFPADRTDIAAAIGRALLEIGGVEVETVTTAQCPPEGPKNCRCVQVPVNESDIAAIQPGDTVSIETENGTYTGTASDVLLNPGPDEVAIGPRPGSVFADPTETMQALGKDLDAAGTLPQVDPKGVAFNAAMCGISAKPFYETGKTSGQWKKRRGVDQAAYDAWYAEQLEQGAAQTTVDTAPVDTAGAFGTTDAQHTDPFHTHAPTTCGDFMGWASAKQAAKLLTQDDIGLAYTAAGLVITDLFPPNGDAVIAERVAILYAALSAKAGA